VIAFIFRLLSLAELLVTVKERLALDPRFTFPKSREEGARVSSGGSTVTGMEICRLGPFALIYVTVIAAVPAVKPVTVPFESTVIIDVFVD
jgi:hypothetical protein